MRKRILFWGALLLALAATVSPAIAQGGDILELAAPPLIGCLGPPGITSSQGIATLSIF